MPRTTIPSKSTQSFISQLVEVVGRLWVAFWNPLIVLYRLVVVSRRNIDPLPIESTREGVRIRIWRPKPTSNLRKKKSIQNCHYCQWRQLQVQLHHQQIDYNNSSASLRSPSQKTLNDDQRHQWWLLCQRSQKAPALISDVMTVGTSAFNKTLLHPKAAMNMIGWLQCSNNI